MPKRGNNVYHRKDGLWEARYVKEVDTLGKKKYGSVYAHSCKEAKEKRQNIIDNIRLYEQPPVIRDMTVTQLANEYLFISKNRVKASTYQRYQGFLKNHLQYFDKLPVIYLNTAAIHKFAIERTEKGLEPQSVNSILVFLHSCLKYGSRQYKLPLPEIVYLKTNKKEMRVLSFDEQKKLESFLNNEMDIYKFSILLALYTGLRIGELCALKWEDIDETSIKVKRTIQRLQSTERKGTELYIGTPKTVTSMREIPIPSFLKTHLEYFRTIAEKEYVLGTHQIPIAEPRVLQIKFKSYLNNAGIEKANFHALRHTFATRCVECGFEVKSLSEVLGHANVQITLNRYVHSSFQLKMENMEKLKQLL